MLPIAPDTLLQQRYRILNILGEGKLGRTYLAIDCSRADAYCAIEEIVPFSQFSGAADRVKESFKQEALLLARLQHLQLPRFWIAFEAENRLFLVRDYIAGKTYRQLLDNRRDLSTAFSETEVWQFLLQVLPVIGYLHTKGIVHRDLSPEHMICRESDSLPVPIDLGIIKEFANQLQASPISQGAVGQPGYAPVEQLRSGEVHPNTDLYALAVTAIVLLTGKEPSALFEGDLLNWDWRRWTQIDDNFASVLGRMLRPNPPDRYQSAVEVSQALQSFNLSTSRPPELDRPNPNRPSTIPTVAISDKNPPEATNRDDNALINLNPKSVWEKPQVFIPLGVLISLLAGVGSWFGVTQLLHSRSPDPVASTPPKQIDFDNPTIPTKPSSPSPTASDLIQPEMNRAIVKEGTVDANTPVRYRISAVAGQNLDIQLVSATSQTADPSKTTPSTDPATSISSPIAPISPSPSQTKDPTYQNPPISVPSPQVATQVLMTVLSPTGTALDNQSDRVIGWRGQVPTSGEYTIELRPIKGLTGSSFPYKLSVTQLSVTPSPIPTTGSTPSPSLSPSIESTPSPSTESTPSTGSTPPLGIPTPDSNGTNIIPSGSPSSTPIVVPSTAPTNSERSTRTRRRSRVEPEASPRVKERNRVESSDEATPTTRRRRNRVESSKEATPTTRRRRSRVESSDETTSTPRRNRNRRSNSETQPSPSPTTSPDSGDNGSNSTPTPEPSIGIPVPPAKNPTPKTSKTDGNKAVPSPVSDATDPE